MRALFFGLTTALAVSAAALAQAPLQVGAALTHLKAQCAPDPAAGRHRDTGVAAQDNIILHYDQPAVRAQARADMADLRRQGASILSANLWFRHAEDARRGRRPDTLGMPDASQGRLPDQVIANLAAYAADARDAGFGLLSVAVEPQNRANPKCRQDNVWGGCYDAGFVDLTWQVTDQVAATVRPLQRPGFQVVIDVSPENCPASMAGPLVQQNQTAFTREMVSRFAHKYGQGFTVSCGGRPAQRGLEGLRALADIYRDAGVTPSTVDVHLYASPPADIDAVLGAADRLARQYRAPLYVMETDADNAPLWAEARRLKASGRTPTLAGLVIWPRNRGDACDISVSPPFDLRRFTSGG